MPSPLRGTLLSVGSADLNFGNAPVGHSWKLDEWVELVDEASKSPSLGCGRVRIIVQWKRHATAATPRAESPAVGVALPAARRAAAGSHHEGREVVEVAFDWAAEEAGDLALTKGATVEVLDRASPGEGWWTGRLEGASGASGVFPANRVSRVEYVASVQARAQPVVSRGGMDHNDDDDAE